MEIVRSLAPSLAQRPTVLTMGKFDGLHLGHRQLISTAVRHARNLGFLSAVLTWEPHPNVILRPGTPPQLLSNLEEKIELIGSFDPDLLIIAPFTEATKAIPADAYMAQICAALPLRELWVGEGFAMGRDREGDVPSLMAIGQQRGFAVGAASKVEIEGEVVSASRVRELLAAGQVERAAMLLGRPFGLRGTVVPGDQRGRVIGFPTANLDISANHVLPADGVYACRVLIDGTSLPAVTNVGLRPTFGLIQRTVEAHLLDWSGDIYGRTLQITFLHRLRGEQKFAGIEALIAQIRQDAEHARQLLIG
ncbi:bifunctional riboflavin kinase/FAD synthetase [Candidatus Oscillochloris fontis]|uniref:bifunctional riboflavin kinase/FAD synthetase n=1 Tax=Candidatus Oscillochloris fontis TaxID=2496868 RepID=UPI00101D22E4|nr:bifunctional riboflavin kinase/FAD synthetase [Candidatus Oscillochloris fontis]